MLGLNGHMKNNYIQSAFGLCLACSTFLFISCDSGSSDSVGVNPQLVPLDISGYKIQFLDDAKFTTTFSSDATAVTPVNGVTVVDVRSENTVSFGASDATVIAGNLVSVSGSSTIADLQSVVDEAVADIQSDPDSVGVGSTGGYTYNNGVLTVTPSDPGEPTIVYSLNFGSATGGSFTAQLTPSREVDTADGVTTILESQLMGTFVILSTN